MAEARQASRKRTYSIGIVGMRGAGKTVFLAAMHHQLAIHRGAGFFLQTPQERTLMEMFSTLSEKHKWLESTKEGGDISEWDFSVNVLTPQKQIYESCLFRYYDYAGGLLERHNLSDPTAVEALDNRLGGCDALVGILDGEKICHTLRGTDVNQMMDLFSVDIPYVIEELSKPKGSNLRAVQIIISKWDELQKHGITLKDVRTLLTRNKEFSKFMRTITPVLPGESSDSLPVTVRLIPVSSVGFGFVESNDPEQGMIIKSGARAEPWNVETPFACLLPDIVMNEIKLHNKIKSNILSKKYDKNHGVWYHVVKFARHALVVMADPDVVPEPIQAFLFNLGAEYERRKEMQEHERERLFETEKAEAVEKVSDSISAFEYAVAIFARMQAEFDARFPDNKLA